MSATARQLQTGLPGISDSSARHRIASGRAFQSPALQAFALSRGLLLLVTAFTAALLRTSPIAMWNQWDSRWYVGIALHGYHWGFGGRSALAFYPLFPAILRALADVGLSPVGAGLLVSNVAFLGALFYLHAFLKQTAGEVVARRAVWLMALFPTAFFTVAPYTESLFLLCAVGATYHAWKRQVWAAGFWLAGAAMTHSTAIILVVPLLMLLNREPAAAQLWRDGAELSKQDCKRDRPPRRLRVLRALPLFVPSVLAWAIYGLYLQSQHISLSLVFRAEQGWHRSMAFPWTGFVASFRWLAQYASAHTVWASENIGELAVTFVFLALTAWAWPRLDSVGKAYCAGFWLLVLSVTQWRDSWYAPFGSMDRFVLALFPLAAWAAWRFQTRLFRVWLVVSAAGMCALGGIYIAGVWVG